MSWQVVYHFDEQGDAENVFDGVARAYDHADRLELVNPEGDIVETIYVTVDAARAAGIDTDEQGVRR